MITPKVIVTVAPTGGMASKKQNPNLPTQPQEIADQVYASYNEGSPVLASHQHDKFGLVSYVHPDNSTALDSFSKWYGDACAVLKAPTPTANV